MYRRCPAPVGLPVVEAVRVVAPHRETSSNARPRRQLTSNMSGGQKRNMMTAKYDMKRLQGIMKIDDKLKAKLAALRAKLDASKGEDAMTTPRVLGGVGAY